MKLEDRKKEFKDRLINELFVERYDTFKESVTLINEALTVLKIDYKYSYDEFCTDYVEECMIYMDENPKVDMMDQNQLYFYALPIIISMIDKIKNKHGFKTD